MANQTTQEELAALREAYAALKVKLESRNKVTFKVGEKGALSMYGIGRFPATFYSSQWQRILQHAPEIQAALVEFADRLVVKPE